MQEGAVPFQERSEEHEGVLPSRTGEIRSEHRPFQRIPEDRVHSTFNMLRELFSVRQQTAASFQLRSGPDAPLERDLLRQPAPLKEQDGGCRD